jgi:RNA polymerase sigma factor (sigma-70 family)
MTDEEFFLANRAEIERAVRFVASYARLPPEDADELLSSVNLHIIENDYAVIRKFKGGCSFATYVVVIARHALADMRMQVQGRFRNSAEAKRLGEPAMRLEALLRRDYATLEDATAAVQREFPALTANEIADLAARLPQRTPRPREVSLGVDIEPKISSDSVEELALDHERAARAARINHVVQETLAQVSRGDRVAFQFRWGSPPVSVADIARMFHRDQKQLYRRLDAVGRQVQKALLAAGITVDEILELTDGTGCHFDFGLADTEIDESRQPNEPEGSGNHEVPE